MRIAITGPEKLSEKQEEDVRFLLDSICCRYATETHSLVSGGRSGVESIAETLAKQWNWSDIDVKKKAKYSWWMSNPGLDLDRQVAKDCDLLIVFQYRNYNYTSIANRVDHDKVVVEFYI